MRHRIALLLALLGIVVSGVVAQDGSTDEIVISTALQEQLDGMEVAVMELRELAALSPMERDFPTREEAIALLLADVQKQLPDKELFEETQFYRAFDFFGPEVDLWNVYSALLADQVAGFYDSDTQIMHILLLSGEPLGDSLPPFERITYAHEYVHALQDQHFGLAALANIEEPDCLYAALALVEGDAMVITEQYMTLLLETEPIVFFELAATALSVDTAVPEETPPILEVELMSPYLDGAELVAVLYDQGGWEAVNAAYTNLPQSSEQILHPEQYLSGDVPLPVEIVEVGDILGAEWTLLFNRTLGEFYLREYLATQLNSVQANRAAAGWGGDRYGLYYNEVTDQRAWVLRLAWDAPEDAAEFVAAYQEFAGLRMDTTIDDPVLGDTLCWQNDTEIEALCLLDQGDTFIAYAPTWELAAGMIAAQED